MANIIKILIDADTRAHFVSASEDIKKGDLIVVKLANGNELASVVCCLGDCELKPEENYDFVRKATQQDIENNKLKTQNNASVRKKVQTIITKHKIDLKLIKVHESFDNSKMLVVYTAPQRIDFRELVKELAGVFKTHIEMRQITDRESAMLLGDIAECGQELCCRRFLYDPQVVTIKMAKAQEVALNPTKINGACGKLRCCMAYEYGTYKDILQRMPEMGAVVSTPDGNGTVIYRDLLREQVEVRFNDDKVCVYDLEKINKTA